MPLLKKLSPNWTPIEFPNVKVGDVIQFDAPYEELVRGGMAMIVDKDGNELELPGQMFECPVCFEKIQGLQNFTDHVSGHMPKAKPVAKEPVKKDIPVENIGNRADEIRAKRLAALEKARAARLANLKK